MKPTSSNPAPFIIAALIVGLFAYWYFFVGTGNETPITIDTTENPAQTKFKVLVSQLASVAFDTTLFNDPRFMGLIDLGVAITPETTGRFDPFAPIPGFKSASD